MLQQNCPNAQQKTGSTRLSPYFEAKMENSLKDWDFSLDKGAAPVK